MSAEAKLLSKQDLAERWDTCVGSIDNLVRRGDLQPIKIGRLVRFSPAEVKRFLQSARVSRQK